jgi:hypothetical protein
MCHRNRLQGDRQMERCQNLQLIEPGQHLGIEPRRCRKHQAAMNNPMNHYEILGQPCSETFEQVASGLHSCFRSNGLLGSGAAFHRLPSRAARYSRCARAQSQSESHHRART